MAQKPAGYDFPASSFQISFLISKTVITALYLWDEIENSSFSWSNYPVSFQPKAKTYQEK